MSGIRVLFSRVLDEAEGTLFGSVMEIEPEFAFDLMNDENSDPHCPKGYVSFRGGKLGAHVTYGGDAGVTLERAVAALFDFAVANASDLQRPK